MNRDDRRALLYFSQHVRNPRRWYPWHWWRAIDLLPDPCDMPRGLHAWAQIAESMAYEGRR